MRRHLLHDLPQPRMGCYVWIVSGCIVVTTNEIAFSLEHSVSYSSGISDADMLH